MRNPSVELDNANKAIEHSIETLAFQGRGPVARDVVGNLRHLVEHVAMLAIYGGDYEEDDYFKSINKALKRLQKRRETRFISDFHELLIMCLQKMRLNGCFSNTMRICCF